MRDRILIYVGLLVSLAFLYWSFEDISFYQIWLNIRQANAYFLVASGAIMVAEFVTRALRWKYLLTPVRTAKVNGLFSVLMIGYFTNNLLPGRLGELVRAQFLGINYKVSRIQALATIVVERVFDVLMLLAFFYVCLLLYPFPAWIKRGGSLTALVFLAIVGILYIYGLRRGSLVTLVRSYRKYGRLSEKLASLIENFGEGLAVLRNFRNIAIVVLLSLLIWVLIFAAIHMVLLAFSLTLPLFSAAIVAVMLGLGMMIPSSPASIGVYEGFGMLALVSLGVEKNLALSFSLVLHAVELIVTMSIGFVCFIREISAFNGGGVKLWPGGSKIG
jgi:glycosyltransferase 2 family protein